MKSTKNDQITAKSTSTLAKTSFISNSWTLDNFEKAELKDNF